MDPLNALVQEAIAAVKAGRKQEARDKLLSVIEQNERHEQAWLGLSALVESVEEQRICLENVLAINPANERAQKALAKLGGQFAPPPVVPPPAPPVQPRPAPTSSPTSTANDPFGDSAFGSYDSPSASFDQGWSSPQDASPFGDISFDGFGSTAGTAPEPAPNGAAAYHGSGQAADLPSADEYDQWMADLNLNAGSGMSSMSENESPFGSSPFSNGDAFGSETPPWEEEAQDQDYSPAGSPWLADESPFESDEEDVPSYLEPSSRSGRERDIQVDQRGTPPGGNSSAFGTSFDFGRAPMSMQADQEEEDPFSFEFDDDNKAAAQPFEVASGESVSWLGQGAAAIARTTVSAPPAATKETINAAGGSSAGAAKYYAQIPADIEAVPVGTPPQRVLLVISVLVLLVLNVASIGFLVVTM